MRPLENSEPRSPDAGPDTQPRGLRQRRRSGSPSAGPVASPSSLSGTAVASLSGAAVAATSLSGAAVAAPRRAPWTQRRRDRRIPVHLRVRTTTVDAVLDVQTSSRCYQTNEDDGVLELSRRGARLRCVRAPVVGTRLLLGFFLPGEARPVELIACVRWTLAEFVPGDHGARAVAAVGVELIGGSEAAITRFESAFARLERRALHGACSLATPSPLG